MQDHVHDAFKGLWNIEMGKKRKIKSKSNPFFQPNYKPMIKMKNNPQMQRVVYVKPNQVVRYAPMPRLGGRRGKALVSRNVDRYLHYAQAQQLAGLKAQVAREEAYAKLEMLKEKSAERRNVKVGAFVEGTKRNLGRTYAISKDIGQRVVRAAGDIGEKFRQKDKFGLPTGNEEQLRRDMAKQVAETKRRRKEQEGKENFGEGYSPYKDFPMNRGSIYD